MPEHETNESIDNHERFPNWQQAICGLIICMVRAEICLLRTATCCCAGCSVLGLERLRLCEPPELSSNKPVFSRSFEYIQEVITNVWEFSPIYLAFSD